MRANATVPQRTWQDEIQQRPQLLQVVLQRRSSDEEPATAGESSNDLTKQRVDVLDTMSFVDDNVLPAELFEGRFLAETHLVRRDKDVKVAWDDFVRDEFGLEVTTGCHRGQSARHHVNRV
jgi:hypothetical protein